MRSAGCLGSVGSVTLVTSWFRLARRRRTWICGKYRDVNRSKARPTVNTDSIDDATYKVNNLRQLMRGLNTGVGNIGAPPKNKGIGGLVGERSSRAEGVL